MPIIKQMQPNLANVIAAGEVVDRPASVLKELIENAIDAKATTITVDIKDFGMSKIAVTDDGFGMDKEDAHMAFLRHATSKIMSESDLSHIHTLGFRGEALAAIASVAKVTLMTKQKHSDGIKVVVEGGDVKQSETFGMNPGTKIEVTSLFYNTPARFKYIKSEAAEKQALIEVFDRLALSHPGIAFSLVIDDVLVKQTFGQKDIHALIDQIYGKSVTHDMITFEQTVMKIDLKAYLISPKVNRSRKKDISIFINGRYIRNYAFTQAVIDGYQGFLMLHRYPIAMLYLKMDPSLIDVNVHPQKYEVKLVNESVLSYHITTLIKKALNKHPHQITEATSTKPKELYEATKVTPQTMDDLMSFPSDETSHDDLPSASFPSFDYVGTFAGTYLLFQNQEGLYLMDQHAAQERIRYEHYHEALKHPKHTSKKLLISRPLSLTTSDHETIKRHKEVFHRYGFNFNDSLELIALPMWLKDDEIDLAIETFITMLEEEKAIDLSVLRDHLAKDISCKGSIKANQSLQTIEIERLVADLRTCVNPYTCPHGRPTMIKLSHREVEKMFKRVL